MTESMHESNSAVAAIPGLAPAAREVLTDLIEQAVKCFDDDLSSILLYGSAAEGQLRPTSDINLLLVLLQFPRERIDPLREILRRARALANVKVMFLLDSELQSASEAFAVKFDDIIRRHLVLYGDDPLRDLDITREARIVRLRQVLLNLAIRLRERYAMASLREEQLILVLAEHAAPLRAAAATILEIQEDPAPSGKEALAVLAPALEVPEWKETLANLSLARETRKLSPRVAAETLFQLIAMTDSLRRLVERL